MTKLFAWPIRYKYWLIAGLVIIVHGILTGETFFAAAFGYVAFLKWLLEARIPRNIRRAIAAVVWVGFIIVMGLIYYSHHYLPRGAFYETGDYICENDDRGPCGPELREDFRGLNIPSWAIFVRTPAGFLLAFALCLAGVVASKTDE